MKNWRQHRRRGLRGNVDWLVTVDSIAQRLNERPRMTLGFRSPEEIFEQMLPSLVDLTGT